MFRPQRVNIQCPQCGYNLQAPVFSILDVGQTPELKQALISGQLNAVQCPNCGNISYLATPLLYHDPEHEFLGVFLPAEMKMTENQRQKAIGDLTKALMDALPAEQRRGYMLTPQQFLTMEGMVEKILGFDGITPEMIEASRKKVELVTDLARVKDDSIAFGITVKENEDLLDQEFFMLLGNFILSAQAQGNEEQAELLVDLREKLLPLTEVGQRIQKQRAAVRKLGDRPTRKAILDAVFEGDLDEAEAIAVVARPVMDYQFFQAYSERMEEAPAEKRPALEEKRARLLEIIEELQAADREAAQAAGQIIQELLGAEDMEEAVQQYLPYIDETVLNLLLANIDQAQKQGATAAAGRLKELWGLITAALQQAVPPHLRLLTQLVEAGDPEDIKAVLQANKDEITPEFIQFLEESLDAVQHDEDEDAAERKRVTRQLRNVLTQIKLGV